MSRPAVDRRSRAMALAALLAGDHELQGLRWLSPALRASAEAAAESLLAGTPSELSTHLEAERAELISSPASVSRRYEQVLKDPQAPLGLKQLVLAASRSGPGRFERYAESLRGDDLTSRLVQLSTSLFRAAARGERWAVHLTTRIAPKVDLRRASPRLVPAVTWLCLACRDEPQLLDSLEASWPEELGAILRDCRRPAQEGREVSAKLRDRLEEELASRG